MKDQFISKHLKTRPQLEAVAVANNLNPEGSREALIERIKSLPYSKLKSTIF